MRPARRHRPLTPMAAVAIGAAIVAVLLAVAASDERRTAPAPRPWGYFPAAPQVDRATVWAVGDGAIATGDAPRAVARRIAADRPTRMLYLGDVYELGTAEEFAHGYDLVYGSLRAITLPTPGNHDWPRHAVGYDPYWSQVTGGRPPAPYYARTLAGWRIISLNSEMDHGPASAQIRWLRRTTAGPGSCRLAFWHRPRFSAGKHGDQADIAPIWDVLAGRATLVVNGHEHNMQRLRPRRGIVQFISGAGGRNHYSLDAGDPRLAWSDDETDGALRLVLARGSAHYSFVSSDGRVLDSGSVRCRPGTEAGAAAGPPATSARSPAAGPP